MFGFSDSPIRLSPNEIEPGSLDESLHDLKLELVDFLRGSKLFSLPI